MNKFITISVVIMAMYFLAGYELAKYIENSVNSDDSSFSDQASDLSDTN